MEKFTSPTDFRLKSVKLTPNNGKDPYEIGNIITLFEYGECVDVPFLSAKMDIVDGVALLQTLPIQGGEKVEISIISSFSEEPIDYTLYVWTISNRFARQKQQTYTLGLISLEAILNESTRVTKPLSGNPENILKDLLKNSIKTDKEISTEPSKFDVKFIPNRRTPFNIMKSITRNSVSTSTKYTSEKDKKDKNKTEKSQGETSQSIKGSGGFLFWESKRGYNFFAVDSLCADDDSEKRPKNLQSKSWGPYYEALGSQDDDGSDTRLRIYESYFGSEVDLLQSLRKGKYSSLVVFYNYSTGQYEEYVYKIKDSYDNMAHLGGQEGLTLVPANEIEMSEYPTRIMSILLDHETWYNGAGPASPDEKDGSTSPSKFADWQKYYATQSIARYELLKNQTCTVVIPGNPDICAGDKIDIRLVNKVPTKDGRNEPHDTESSGVYLIGDVTHSYDPLSGSSGKFLTTLRLLRDSYGLKDRPSNHGTK
ncbi:hypothetical cyanophage protein [Synechococcus phage S-RSM4]|uniref:Hypothetical cyanophage protein n=2 Tax=root TaxID=1 RepID=C7BVJ5_9CAUD|nr:tail protein [Synechococcus phage S-RSM4]CAR63424.1 hypothetical cyanophage protein [Synechococcus phage S-RSM4]